MTLVVRASRWLILTAAVCLTASVAVGQEKTAEKPKTFLEELVLFSYLENSYVFNLNGAGHGGHNELRLYDFDRGYTFNMAEFSVKKDPSDRYPFGFGLVVTGGQDARKNHALGIFRGDDDVFPFKDTEPIDLQEAYGSYKIPIGSGLTLKAGKFVTLLGYEVIESPNNLNFSRSFAFSFGIPLTHVGALASYTFGDSLTVTPGPVVGRDVARDNNDSMSVMGQFASTPFKDFTASLNWVTGPEQLHEGSFFSHNRTVLDLVVSYTGIKKLTIGLGADYGRESKEPTIVDTRDDTTATWYGIAGYAAYDWTDRLRTAARAEWFEDPESVRTAGSLGDGNSPRAGGNRTTLWEITGTLQYKIWKGLVGRLEDRHDEANENVFKPDRSFMPTRKGQDTFTIAAYYSFF